MFNNKGKSDITKYVTFSENKKERREMEKTSPLEDNWELAMRIKEILSENYEKWKVFQKEKEELRIKRIQKEKRFEMIREKKRKWEIRKEESTPKETYIKEIKEIEHYEMWWNIWQRRRGQRSALEHSIEKTELERMKMKWETDIKGPEKETPTHESTVKGKEKGVTEQIGAENIEQYWKQLEEVLENIGMDDIWLE